MDFNQSEHSWNVPRVKNFVWGTNHKFFYERMQSNIEGEVAKGSRANGKRCIFIDDECGVDGRGGEEYVLGPEEARSKKKQRRSNGRTGAMSKSTLRKWQLVTLSHTETRGVGLEECVQRIEALFTCEKVVGVEEGHSGGGKHYHIAIECSDASKHTATKKIRGAFPEFEGMQCNVRAHKAFTTMLVYITKEANNADLSKAVFGGEYTRDEALAELRAKRGKKVNAVCAVRKHIKAGGTIAGLTENDEIAPFMITSCSSVIRFAECVSEAAGVTSTLEKIKSLAEGGSVELAEQRLMQTQIDALEVFVSQLQGRKPRDPQLYLVGPTGTGKTYVFQLLAEHTSCFIPCLENNDRAFAGYSDEKYDWMLLNDFHDNVKFQTLSNLCEGISMTLNGYGMQKTKRKNIPLVFTANSLPRYKNLDENRREALLDRLEVVECNEKMPRTAEGLDVKDLCAFIVHNFLTSEEEKM